MPQINIIIGASRGIGLEFTRQLLGRGESVIATERSTSSHLKQMQSEYPDYLTILKCDVSDKGSIKKLGEEVGKLGLNIIDKVVINAGVLVYPNRISESSFATLSHHIQTNTLGPLHTASTLVSLQSIHINTLVFMSSDSGSTGNFLSYEDGFGAYSMSKAALNQGLRHLSFELHRKHATEGKGRKTVVLALHPGEVNTDMAKNVDLDWEVKGSIGVEESVRGCLKVIGDKGFGGVDEGGRNGAQEEEGAATFWTWDGRRYPW